ncbi:hypothetical protein [Nocardioides sp. GY 10127]|uniref:hypothetical protein n=1 Tax=Nocardioides sp. GY 10127 TaxID=2569762 RepID=UPI0010A930C5|nr:hypothetical protein [Nocardioides sp. GY 10127]TIC78791.1 hypothetical protein E8D37_19030 [Nocardioides sp. GY 10127]
MDDLIRSLMLERYGQNGWWKRDSRSKPAPAPLPQDDELTCRRRRDAAAAEAAAAGLDDDLPAAQ